MIKAVFFDFDGVLTTYHRSSITIANNIHEIAPEYSTSKIMGFYTYWHDDSINDVSKLERQLKEWDCQI